MKITSDSISKFTIKFMAIYFWVLALCYFLKGYFVDIANAINLCSMIKWTYEINKGYRRNTSNVVDGVPVSPSIHRPCKRRYYTVFPQLFTLRWDWLRPLWLLAREYIYTNFNYIKINQIIMLHNLLSLVLEHILWKMKLKIRKTTRRTRNEKHTVAFHHLALLLS